MVVSDAYLRKSSDDEGKSVGRQERDWRADCAREGFTPGRVFADPDLSASRYATKKRPDFIALMAHLQSGHAEVLSMWETSRGSRQMSEWVALLDLCREKGVQIRVFGGYSPETYDPRKPRDREALLREGINSERESETVAERARTGARDLAFSGRPPGPMLFGYTRVYDERGRFENQKIHPGRKRLLDRMKRHALAGKSMNSLAKEFNDKRIPAPRGGGMWHPRVMKEMLLNPGYAGRRIHNGEVAAEDCWPVIITDGERLRMAAIFAERTVNRTSDGQLVHQCSSAMVCGVCGGAVGAKRGRHPGQFLYGCKENYCTFAAGESVDDLVNEVMCARLVRPDASSLFAPRTDGGALDVVEAELRELERELADYVELALARKISPKIMAKMEGSLAPQIEDLKRQMAALAKPSKLSPYVGLDVSALWPDLPVTIRREFIVTLADLVLAPCGKGVRWTKWRLAESRWKNDDRTWGEIWVTNGEIPPARKAAA